jgi:hypothetical protein
VNEDRLRQLLRSAPVHGGEAAQAIGRRLLEEAFAERPAMERRPSAPRLAIVLAAGALLAALLLSPAGADVRDWLGDVIEPGRQEPAPALTSLPGGGRLLVISGTGAWVVHEDGSRRLLGDYDTASWSPNGLYAAVARGNQLTAVEPDGDPRWSLTRPEAITGVRWSPDPGFRVAYIAGGELRVVGGDGTGDRLLAPRVAPVAPAWRPGPRHLLAYFTPAGAVEVVNADADRRLLRLPAASGAPVGLEWSADGARLLVISSAGARAYDRRGRPRGELGGRVTDAAFRPGGHREIAALVRRPSRNRPASQVFLAAPETPRKQLGPLFSVPGTLTGLEWSPDGRRILVGWPDADQWLFIPRAQGRVRSAGDVSAQFAPGDSIAQFPRLAGWCCPAQP